MRKTTQRVAALAIAATGFALIGSGCSSEADKDKAKETTTTTVTTSLKTSEPETTETAAPSSTTIAGQDGTEYVVEGAILTKLNSLDETQRTALGAPTDNQVTNPDGGIYQQFDGGVIVSNKDQTHVVWGKIRDKWNELDGSQGELGYPTSDETTNAEGQKQTTFEHGTITWTEGEEEAVVVTETTEQPAG